MSCPSVCPGTPGVSTALVTTRTVSGNRTSSRAGSASSIAFKVGNQSNKAPEQSIPFGQSNELQEQSIEVLTQLGPRRANLKYRPVGGDVGIGWYKRLKESLPDSHHTFNSNPSAFRWNRSGCQY
jgi:hypothetical protein